MENGDFSISIRIDDNQNLTLESAVALDAVEVVITSDPNQSTNSNNGYSSSKWSLHSNNKLLWKTHIDQPFNQYSIIRVVASTQQVLYFGESLMEFHKYETLFDQSNF